MANKKISELDVRASLSLSDLMVVGDPATGYAYKTTLNDLKTITGAGVISFNGRFGAVVPAEGDYSLTQLSDVIITSASNGQVLKFNGSNWVNAAEAAETDTLQSVTDRGATTTNAVTIGSNPAATQLTVNGAITTKGIFTSEPLSFNGTNKYVYANDLILTTNNNLGYIGRTIFEFGMQTPVADSGTGTMDLVKINMPVNTGTQAADSRALVIDFNSTSNAGVLTAIDAVSGKIRLRDLTGVGNRMVVTDANGVLSTQAITTGTVTSVGLTTGTAGTNVNVSGSPVTGSGTITLNIPDASATARGVITTGAQTIAGIKTFSDVINFGSVVYMPNNTFDGSSAATASASSSVYLIGSFTTAAYKNLFNSIWSGVTLTDQPNRFLATNLYLQKAITAPPSGSYGLVANLVIQGTKITSNTGTVTTAAALVIDGSTTGATNNYSIWVNGGNIRFDSLAGTGSRMVVADANGVLSTQSYTSGTVTSIALATGTSGTDIAVSGSPITSSGTITLDVPTASATNRGALSSADWSTFNSKQAALNGTGFVKISGTTISYDNSTYLTTSSAASTYLTLSGGSISATSAGYALSVTNIEDSSQGLLVRSTDADTTLYLARFQSSASAVSTTWVDRFSIAKNGSTVIGDNAPFVNVRLYVKGSSTSLSDYALNLADSNGADIAWFANDKTARFNGNVGIGKTPSVALDVVGAGTFSGNLGAANLSGTNTGDQTLSGLGGVPTSRTLTINGTSFDLSANRSWTINAGLSGSGSVNQLAKFVTNSTTLGDSLITSDTDVKINAFVGIGTTSTPTTILDIRNFGNAIITARNVSGGALTYASLRIGTVNSGGVGDSIAEIRGLSQNVNNRDVAMTFLVSNGTSSQTEAMRITKDRNLNIGDTSDTAYKLNVAGTLNATGAVTIGASGTYVTHWNDSGGNYLEAIGASDSQRVLRIQGPNSGGSYTQFFLNTASQTMTFATGGSNRFSVNASGTLTVSGDVIAYGSPSDFRLKRIKEVIKNPIDKIMSLSGYRFDWNEVNPIAGIKDDVGVIAQEVEKVLPELARTNENGYKSVRYHGLTALLIEAVKEQQKQIEDLKSKF